MTNSNYSALVQYIPRFTNCFGSLNTFMMHLAIPNMLGPFFSLLRRPLIQFGTLASATKWLNSSSTLHMFNTSFFTFATEHSPFALPISTPFAEKSMQCPTGIKVATLVEQHLYSWHPYTSRPFTGDMCERHCHHSSQQKHKQYANTLTRAHFSSWKFFQ